MTDTTQPIVYSASAISGGHQGATDADIDGDIWASIFGGGDGIVGASSITSGGMLLTCSGDVCAVPAFTYKLDGFVLPVAAQNVTLAPVGATTVYSIGVLSDSSKETLTDAGGRLSLWAGPVASKPSGAGKKYNELRTVTRYASTPMSAGTPISSTSLHFSGDARTFAAAGAPTWPSPTLGCIAVMGDGAAYVYVPVGNSSAAWTPFGSETGSQTAGTVYASGWSANPSSATTMRVSNGQYEIHLRFRRTGAPIYPSGGGGITDSKVLTLPAGFRSTWLEPTIGILSTGGPNFGVLLTMLNGVVTLNATTAGTSTITTGSTVSATFRGMF